jgi:NAD(P)-dependent dehydrogenase (short-subunit alcohol dehydrogenase family)
MPVSTAPRQDRNRQTRTARLMAAGPSCHQSDEHNQFKNAAIEGWCKFDRLTDEAWERTFAIDMKGTFVVTQTALPDMEAAGWGRIVNASALGGQMGGAYDMTHHNASKGAR